MPTLLLRDFLLSYCPAAVRSRWRPESQLTTLRAATWSGMAQFLLATLVSIIRLKSYFIVRSHQMAAHLSGSNETGQAILALLVSLEYLLYPLSLFLLYLAVAGVVRFLGGLLTHEVVPDFLVSVFFKLSDSLSRSRDRRREGPARADFFDRLPECRVRIASSTVKPGWNASITIGINGEWFELEREDHNTSTRPFVYVLKPSSPGKVLRGYQEYDIASAVSAQAARTSSTEGNAST